MTMMSSVIAFDPRAGQPLLRRPRLLVQAARAGLSGWKRDRDLRRVLKSETLPRPEAVLARLHAEEARHNLARHENRAEYDLHRHIMLLIAILAETAEIAPRAVQPAAPQPRGRAAIPFKIAAKAPICP